MKCPLCDNEECIMIISRYIEGNDLIYRVRECVICGAQFATYEIINQIIKPIYIH